jgi:hypothetical protein
VGVSSGIGVGVGRFGGDWQMPHSWTSGSQSFAATHTPGHEISPPMVSHEPRGSLAQQRSPGHGCSTAPPQPSVSSSAPAPIA